MATAASADEPIALGHNGFSFRPAEDGGWVMLPRTVTTEGFLGAWSQSPAEPWAVGASGGVYTLDGGLWLRNHPTGMALNAIWGTSEERLWTVGRSGRVWRRVNRVWAAVTPPVAVELFGVHGRADDDFYVVGDLGVALHWNGSAFRVLRTGTLRRLRAVWVDPVHGVIAVGAGGATLRLRTSP